MASPKDVTKWRLSTPSSTKGHLLIGPELFLHCKSQRRHTDPFCREGFSHKGQIKQENRSAAGRPQHPAFARWCDQQLENANRTRSYSAGTENATFAALLSQGTPRCRCSPPHRAGRAFLRAGSRRVGSALYKRPLKSEAASSAQREPRSRPRASPSTHRPNGSRRTARHRLTAPHRPAATARHGPAPPPHRGPGWSRRTAARCRAGWPAAGSWLSPASFLPRDFKPWRHPPASAPPREPARAEPSRAVADRTAAASDTGRPQGEHRGHPPGGAGIAERASKPCCAALRPRGMAAGAPCCEGRRRWGRMCAVRAEPWSPREGNMNNTNSKSTTVTIKRRNKGPNVLERSRLGQPTPFHLPFPKITFHVHQASLSQDSPQCCIEQRPQASIAARWRLLRPPQALPVPWLAAGCEHIHANGLSQFSHYTQQVEKKSVICWLKRPRLKTVECAQNSAHNQ